MSSFLWFSESCGMSAVFGKTVDASAELLGSKQIQNSFQISGSAEASSRFLHVFVALFFVSAHFFTFSWWACTCIQILSLCLSLHMIGSMMCPSKRSSWRFSSCWPESAVFIWYKELTRRADSFHIDTSLYSQLLDFILYITSYTAKRKKTYARKW